jgi:hypothetical protein
MLGQLCERRGLNADALAFFQVALERDPGNPRRYALLLAKAQAWGERALAVQIGQEGLQRFPEHDELRRMVNELREAAQG